MSEPASNNPRSTRRALLGGLTLGAAAVAAETIRPSSAQAANGDPIVLGTLSRASSVTQVANSGDANQTNGDMLQLYGAGFGGVALHAASYGDSPAINAVGGGDGVRAVGGGNGATGLTSNSLASGVYGENLGGGYGVAGRSNALNGKGVLGEATATGGIGLLGVASNEGAALVVQGKAKFDRSGKLTIPAGASSAVVTLAGVSNASIVLATLQKHAGGFTVESAVPSAGSFRIRLNKPAPSGGLPVGWFVIN